MNSDRPTAAHRRGGTLAVWACLLVAVVSRLSFVSDPFRNDAGLYAQMGRTLYEGGVLYRDFWESKLPGIALMTAPLYALFGGHWVGYVIVGALIGVAGPFILARAARTYVGEHAYLPTLLFLLVQFNLTRLVLTGLQIESVQGLLAMVAAALGLRALARGGAGPLFLAGLACGAAAFAKPTGLAVGGALAVALLVQSKRDGAAPTARRLGLLTAGAILPLAAIGVWVWQSPMRAEIPNLFRQIRLYGSETPWQELVQLKTAIFLSLPFVPLVLRVVLARVRTDPAMKWPPRPIVWFALTWVTAEVVGVVVQRRLYSYHYLVIVPPVGLLFGLLPLRESVARLGISLVPTALLSLAFAAPAFARIKELKMTPASRYLLAHTDPSDRIWADPSPRYLLETGLLPGSRLGMSFYFVNHDEAPKEFGDTLLADFDERTPKYVVMKSNWRDEMRHTADATPGFVRNPARRKRYYDAFERIEAYLDQHYALETELDGKLLYRRLSPESTVRPSP